MTESPLVIRRSVIAAVVAETQAYGSRRLETGGFLMCNVGEDEASAVAMAGTTGIVRHPFLLQISERALDRLFVYADSQGFWLPVQFHSHMQAPSMSPTDEKHGLRVEGFVSTILPDFSEPPSDLSAWGWWRFSGGSWVGCEPAGVIDGDCVAIVTFDESGVRER